MVRTHFAKRKGSRKRPNTRRPRVQRKRGRGTLMKSRQGTLRKRMRGGVIFRADCGKPSAPVEQPKESAVENVLQRLNPVFDTNWVRLGRFDIVAAGDVKTGEIKTVVTDATPYDYDPDAKFDEKSKTLTLEDADDLDDSVKGYRAIFVTAYRNNPEGVPVHFPVLGETLTENKEDLVFATLKALIEGYVQFMSTLTHAERMKLHEQKLNMHVRDKDTLALFQAVKKKVVDTVVLPTNIAYSIRKLRQSHQVAVSTVLLPTQQDVDQQKQTLARVYAVTPSHEEGLKRMYSDIFRSFSVKGMQSLSFAFDARFEERVNRHAIFRALLEMTPAQLQLLEQKSLYYQE
jgi:hypothetical protein